MSQLTLFQPNKPVKQQARPTNPVTLRPHQVKIKSELYQQIKQGFKRCLIVAPCAAGKTIISASIIYDAVSIKNKKVLFVAPFTCLISQSLDALAKFGISAGVIAGGYKENRQALCQIATIQTLAVGRDISWFDYDICILDECHILSYSAWSRREFPMLKEGHQVTSLFHLSNELKILEFDLDLLSQFNLDNLTFAQVKQAYSNLAKTHHPDYGGSKEKMQELNQAWEVIRKYKDVFASELEENNKILIGLTATPWRLSKRESMGDIFQAQVLGLTPSEMVQAGYLVPCVYYGIRGANLDGVATVAGDFDLGDLEVKCADSEVIKSAVDNYLKICPDRLFICFACTVRHAQLLLDEFNSQGVKTAIITGDTPDDERERIFEALRNREIQGVTSVNCLGVGFDLPEISAIVHCRPTKSLSLYIQGIGRGQRLAQGKTECIVLDQAGNCKRHGFIEDITYPELHRSSQQEKGECPAKDCPECDAIIRTFDMTCPECGYIFPEKDKKKPVGELELIIKPQDQQLYSIYQERLRVAYQYGNSPWTALFDVRRLLKNKTWWPPQKGWELYAIFGKAGSRELANQQKYLVYLQGVAARTNKDPWWIEGEMKRQFGFLLIETIKLDKETF